MWYSGIPMSGVINLTRSCIVPPFLAKVSSAMVKNSPGLWLIVPAPLQTPQLTVRFNKSFSSGFAILPVPAHGLQLSSTI